MSGTGISGRIDGCEWAGAGKMRVGSSVARVCMGASPSLLMFVCAFCLDQVTRHAKGRRSACGVDVRVARVFWRRLDQERVGGR